MFLKDKPCKLEPECITMKEIIPTEPTKPTMPTGFCKEIPEIKTEKVILRKEDGKPEEIIKKVVDPIDKSIKTTTVTADNTDEEVVEKKFPNILPMTGKTNEVIKKEILPITGDTDEIEEEIETPKIQKKDIIKTIKKDSDWHSFKPIEHCMIIKKPIIDEIAIRDEIMAKICNKENEKKMPEEKIEEIIEGKPIIETKEEKPEEKINEIIEGKPITTDTTIVDGKIMPIVYKFDPKEEKPEEKIEEIVEGKPTKEDIPILKAKKMITEKKCEPKKVIDHKKIDAEHKKIASEILDEIKSGLTCGKSLIQTGQAVPEEFFDKAIAKSDSITDTSVNAKATGNSIIKGVGTSSSEQNASAVGSDKSGAIANSKGKINSVTNLNASDNSKINGKVKSNIKGNAIDKANDGSFAVSDNRDNLENINTANADNSSNINLDSEANSTGTSAADADKNSIAISNSRGKNTQTTDLNAKQDSNINSKSAVKTNTISGSSAENKSIAKANSEAEATGKSDLKAIEKSKANADLNVDSQSESGALAKDNGNATSISKSKSKGNIEGDASKESTVNLDVNNKDISASMATSKGEVSTPTPKKVSPILRKKIVKEEIKKPEIIDCLSPSENESLNDIIEGAMKKDVIKKEKKESVKDIIDAIKEDKKVSPVLKKKIVKKEIKKDANIYDCLTPSENDSLNDIIEGAEIKKEKKESVKDMIDELVKDKKVSPVLKADKEKDKEEELEEVLEEEKKEISTPKEKIVDKAPFEEMIEDKAPVEEMIEDKAPLKEMIEDKTPMKEIEIDVNDCKGPSKVKDFNYGIFGKADAVLPVVGKRKSHLIHGKKAICGRQASITHDPFSHEFFRTETFPRGGVLHNGERDCYPSQFHHDGDFGFGENDCNRGGSYPAGVRRLRGPIKKRIVKGRGAIPINGGAIVTKGRGIAMQKGGKLVVAKDDMFKIADKEINYGKVCKKMCKERSLPESTGSESKTGKDGKTLFCCTCGTKRLNWFKSGKPIDGKLNIQEILSDSTEGEKIKQPMKKVCMIKKPVNCDFDYSSTPLTEESFGFDFGGKKCLKEKMPVLKACEKKDKDSDFLITKPEITPIDVKGHFVDTNAHKIKGVSKVCGAFNC